jgi:uncharacterized protein (DUF2132 family)
MPKEDLQNSPLHGLSAEAMLTELVEFYGWDVLDAAIDLKCFRIKPTIPSCLAFLKKAEWARNRVEDFYLYQFKRMPKPSVEEQELKPRERGFPKGVLPKKPIPVTVKTVEKVETDREPRIKKIRPERVRPVDELQEEEEPQESTFKSRFSDSRFRK